MSGAGSSSAGELSLARRRSASSAGPSAMMTSLGGCSGRSLADREALGDQLDCARVGWVACAGFRLAAEVAYVRAGDRQLGVPEHGYVIVVWKAPPSAGPPLRPPIVAVGEDGSRLTGLNPGRHVDSLTWAAVEAALAGD